MRGEAQDLTMNRTIIDRLFEDVDDCKTVFFTGGEPLLALDEIEYFIDRIIDSQWSTNKVSLITNGSIQDKRLIEIANRFCDSAEGRTFQVAISDDSFHDKSMVTDTHKFYNKLYKVDGVIVNFNSENVKGGLPYFHPSGRGKDYVEQHGNLLDKGYILMLEETMNHRVCIVESAIKCMVYITVSGNVFFSNTWNYDLIEEVKLESIRDYHLSQIIDKHNSECLFSCWDMYFIDKYKNSQFLSCECEKNFDYDKREFFKNDTEFIVSSRINKCISERAIKAKQIARLIFPSVPAVDIINYVRIPDLIADPDSEYQEILSLSEEVTENDVSQYADKDILDRISKVEHPDKVHIELKVLALLRKPNAVIAPNKIYGNRNLEKIPEFKKLAELNRKYQSCEMQPDNTRIVPCVVDNKTIQDQEDEKMAKIVFTKIEKAIRAAKNTNQKIKYAPIKCQDGLRCFNCRKVIQAPERHNIHCTKTEQGLVCQYCKSLNVV